MFSGTFGGEGTVYWIEGCLRGSVFDRGAPEVSSSRNPGICHFQRDTISNVFVYTKVDGMKKFGLQKENIH
jgi:hypothetical protein